MDIDILASEIKHWITDHGSLKALYEDAHVEITKIAWNEPTGCDMDGDWICYFSYKGKQRKSWIPGLILDNEFRKQLQSKFK